VSFFGALQDDHIFQAALGHFILDGLQLLLVQLRGVNFAAFAEECAGRECIFAFTRADIGDGLAGFPAHGLGKARNFVAGLRGGETKGNCHKACAQQEKNLL
jgi:hypothetical protein